METLNQYIQSNDGLDWTRPTKLKHNPHSLGAIVDWKHDRFELGFPSGCALSSNAAPNHADDCGSLQHFTTFSWHYYLLL